MKTHQIARRITISVVLALCTALITAQTTSAGPSSPGPKATSTTLKTTTR